MKNMNKNIYNSDYFVNNKAWCLVKENEVNKLLKYSKNNKNILEIGIGSGFTTELLSNYFKKVIAVDNSKVVIDFVKKKLVRKKNIIFINNSIGKIDLNFKIYNFYLGHILEHLTFPIKFLCNLKKILNDESIGCITVPNSNSIHRQVGVAMGLLKNIDTLNENDIKVGHKRLYTVKKLKKQINKAKFNVINIGGCFIKTMTYNQINKFYTVEQIKGFIEIADKYPYISGDIYVIVKN